MLHSTALYKGGLAMHNCSFSVTSITKAQVYCLLVKFWIVLRFPPYLVCTEAISSIVAKLEMVKNIHLQLETFLIWDCFGIWILFNHVYLLASTKTKKKHCWRKFKWQNEFYIKWQKIYKLTNGSFCHLKFCHIRWNSFSTASCLVELAVIFKQ